MNDDQDLGVDRGEQGRRDDGRRYADELYAPPAGRPADGRRPGGPNASRRPPSRRRHRHRGLIALTVVLAALLIAAGAVYSWARGDISPGGKPGQLVTVVIPRGAGTAQIGRALAAAGVIHGAGLFRWYVKLEGNGPFDAGTYRLDTNESYAAAIRTLEKPPVVLADKLVIPEGFTVHQIAARLAALPGMRITARAFLALSSTGQVRSPYEPAGTDNLEGLLFPATYDIDRTSTASGVMELLVQTFTQRTQQLGLDAAAAKLKISAYDVVKVASIIEGEAKFPSQYADVASVIYNRLRSGMTLGDDSTLIYALRQKNPNLDISKVDYEQPSPYNTRLHTGLPPTPIDNPGAAALVAAMHPAHTDLLYFLEINKSGKLAFASTNAGFQQLTAECQANGLC